MNTNYTNNNTNYTNDIHRYLMFEKPMLIYELILIILMKKIDINGYLMFEIVKIVIR